MKLRAGLLVLVSVLALLAVPLAVEAQQAGKAVRIGYLGNHPPTSTRGGARIWDGFLQGLRERGWVEGHSLVMESRFSEGRYERFPGLAAELVSLKVDVIVAFSPPAIQAAKEATAIIPIVFIGTGFPERLGFVASLARPGGNITGVAFHTGEGQGGKRLELLKEAVPGISRVALLTNPANQGHPPGVQELRVAGDVLKLKLQILEARTPEELEIALGGAIRERADALLEFPDPMLGRQRTRILEFAAKNRLPAAYSMRDWVEEGGLMSYGLDWADHFRHLGAYIDKILKGAKPADLPVERASKFELVINLKTAKALGLTIPPSLLLRADQVIE